MKNKVIFLDFDGVLNSVRSVTADQKIVHALLAKHAILTDGPFMTGFDPVAVKLMWQLAIKSDAYFVISSAWRKAVSLEDIRRMFNTEFKWPIGDEQRIIGVTGKVENGFRGQEVQNWINDHTVGVQNFQYIIIDDSYDFLDEQHKRFVQTDPYEGFLYRDYQKAMKLFDTPLEDERL